MTYAPTVLNGYIDSDWAMNIHHRCSFPGIVFKLTGAASAWKCCVQATVYLGGSSRGGQTHVSSHAYAPIPDMTDRCLYFGLSVLE